MTDTNMSMSTEVADLFAALALANKEIQNVDQNRTVEVKTRDSGKYSYSYATLANIVHNIRDALTKNGVWYTQRIADGNMVTRLIHSSGQWLDTGHVPMPNVSGKPAEVGAVVSFFKRYSLSAAMGLATEEDNSGEDGGRDVNFRARGERRDRDEPRDVATGVEEPPEGWGDWGRTIIAEVETAKDNDRLDQLRDDNKRYINGVNKVDAMIFRVVQEAFTKRRAALDPNASF